MLENSGVGLHRFRCTYMIFILKAKCFKTFKKKLSDKFRDYQKSMVLFIDVALSFC